MAALHNSLKALGPVPFSSLPSEQAELKTYLQKHFSDAQLILESVPQPIVPPGILQDRRSQTASTATEASGISAISLSSERSETLDEEHQQLQKEWGKPIKFSEKENPLGVSVFKLYSKDGKGAWYARRSVHEGLRFEKWKSALQNEFPQSLEVKGGPGAGKVRGMAAETRPEKIEVEGVGVVEVYHLSAQFPAVSARDFVTLIMTSDSALGSEGPRHYLSLSKPCDHLDHPPSGGYVRGQYESVEFIREVPRSKKSASTTELVKSGALRSVVEENRDMQPESTEDPVSPGRPRGRTIGFAESRGFEAKGEVIDLKADDEDGSTLPVEWIMVTRSDPGGNVPRFLVERGTPGGIVSDASKFLDWASKREHDLHVNDSSKGWSEELLDQNSSDILTDDSVAVNEPPFTGQSQTLLSTVVDAAQSTIQAYAPTALSSRLADISSTSIESASVDRLPSISSNDTFASAEEDLTAPATPSSQKGSQKLSAQEKELVRLANRKSELAEKLERARSSAFRDPDNPTDKEQARLQKAQGKHDRELGKAEDRYVKSVKQIEERRKRDDAKEEDRKQREIQKEADRQARAEKKERERTDREERKKEEAKFKAEIERYKAENSRLQEEKDSLKESVRLLQAENTKLVTMIGKLEGGPRLLEELKGSDTASAN